MMPNEKIIVIDKYEFEYIGKLVERKRTEEQTKKYKEKVIEYRKSGKYKELVRSLQRCNYNIENAENIEFCEFELEIENFSNTLANLSGVYLWVFNHKPIYVGETIDMRKRFNTGYGHISPRNIFKGGQSTNCRMNQIAMKLFNQGQEIHIYFKKANKLDREKIEKNILDYNKQYQKYHLCNYQNNKTSYSKNEREKIKMSTFM